MAFEELETITKANAPPNATLSYTIQTKNGAVPKGDKKPKLVISVPTTICGVSKSKTFRLLLGSGVDKGKLLIRGDMVGGIKPKSASPVPGVEPSQMKYCFRFNFGLVPKLGEDTFEGEKRPVRKVSDEEFEITVPESWFEQEAR